MKILVAEDDQLMLKMLEFRLKKDGHEIIVTHDGREAVAKLEEFQPDLVITDIMMPYLSGLEVIGAVKKKYPTGTPVIILSGMGQENVVLEAYFSLAPTVILPSLLARMSYLCAYAGLIFRQLNVKKYLQTLRSTLV